MFHNLLTDFFVPDIMYWKKFFVFLHILLVHTGRRDHIFLWCEQRSHYAEAPTSDVATVVMATNTTE